MFSFLTSFVRSPTKTEAAAAADAQDGDWLVLPLEPENDTASELDNDAPVYIDASHLDDDKTVSLTDVSTDKPKSNDNAKASKATAESKPSKPAPSSSPQAKNRRTRRSEAAASKQQHSAGDEIMAKIKDKEQKMLKLRKMEMRMGRSAITSLNSGALIGIGSSGVCHGRTITSIA